MKYLDLTLPSPEENLALDEALLNHAEDGNSEEILRFWEPDEHFAVLGYSNRSEENVNLNTIREDRISVLRRVSGGGTVLQGPGCLNYALILDIQNRKYLKNIKTTNCHIMKFHAKVLSHIKSGIEYEGTTDLAMGGLKFSGNAQRRKKRFCLFHGTFLLNMNIKLMEKYLNHPARCVSRIRGGSRCFFPRARSRAMSERVICSTREAGDLLPCPSILTA